MVRPSCCDKKNVKRGIWTAEEDAKILAHASKHGTGNWNAVPKKAGLNRLYYPDSGMRRCGKSCRLRWTNYLKHESFTPQEEELIVRLHATLGSRWSIIAQQLPGRTDNDVKNHWNTKLRKKLSEMGIDPITHKPFSQVLADYGYINGGGLPLPLPLPLPNNGTRNIGSLTRDLKKKNAFTFFKPDQSSEIFITNNSNSNSHHDNPSMNLLTQLKSINLVTEPSHHENIPSHFHGEVSSLSSSPTSFSWHEFLLEDAFLPSDPQEQESMREFSSNSGINSDGKQQVNPIEEMAEASSSCGSSFLEAMLDRENDTFLEFPGLLEEPFYY